MTDALFSATGAEKDTRESAVISSCPRQTPSCLTQVSLKIIWRNPSSHMRNKSKQEGNERITVLRPIWWYLIWEHLLFVPSTCFNKELGESNVPDLYQLLVTALCFKKQVKWCFYVPSGVCLRKRSENSLGQESSTLTTWLIVLKLTAFS